MSEMEENKLLISQAINQDQLKDTVLNNISDTSDIAQVSIIYRDGSKSIIKVKVNDNL
jgi:hypothetical protein